MVCECVCVFISLAIHPVRVSQHNKQSLWMSPPAHRHIIFISKELRETLHGLSQTIGHAQMNAYYIQCSSESIAFDTYATYTTYISLSTVVVYLSVLRHWRFSFSTNFLQSTTFTCSRFSVCFAFRSMFSRAKINNSQQQQKKQKKYILLIPDVFVCCVFVSHIVYYGISGLCHSVSAARCGIAVVHMKTILCTKETKRERKWILIVVAVYFQFRSNANDS